MEDFPGTNVMHALHEVACKNCVLRKAIARHIIHRDGMVSSVQFFG